MSCVRLMFRNGGCADPRYPRPSYPIDHVRSAGVGVCLLLIPRTGFGNCPPLAKLVRGLTEGVLFPRVK
ncbi:hypothetical protein GW17_00061957 [Ensete ventricosum]|nr:hypothetical protein GW17_00061957 [Ensete ventricosum]